jgi:cytochrome c biogenesis protein CcmG/thiol:disulfide interchange protein DsbE
MIRKITLVAAFLLLLSTPAAFADDDLDLSAYEGKVVVLDFWASWCVPCRRSFPWWNAMQAKYADDGLVIIGVNLDNELDSAAEFLEEFPAEFQIYYDEQKELAKSYGVQAMPSSYILGRDGELVKKHFGFKVKQQDEFEALLVEALRSGD